MIDKRILLSIFENLGLVLAAISSVWGLLHDVAPPDGKRRKRLSRAGRVALALIVGGLALNLASSTMKARLEATETEKRIGEERLRSLRLASSSQPLQSIRMLWTFTGINEDAMKELRAGEKAAEERVENDDVHKYLSYANHDDWVRSVYRAEVTYRWFAYLATRTWHDRPDVIIRFPLYQSQAVVLPLGCLWLPEGSASSDKLSVGWNLDADRLSKVGAGIECYDFIYADPANFDQNFIERRARFPQVLGWTEVKGGQFVAEMTIGAGSMQEALNRVSTDFIALAQLPQTAEVAVMSEIVGLPWPADNLSGRQGIAEIQYNKSEPPFQNGQLKITPNDIEELSIRYRMSFRGQGEFIDLPGPESPNERYCKVGVLDLRRVEEFRSE